jgi:2-succinyl-5-enolpyruvyl-6-hydroxy-3-cyclohexene-1-carboxylate synthase
VSSAFGVAAADQGPVVLLIGDVALLHDLGGLLAWRRHGLALTIVLLNNDGGGIFEFLPVSAAGDAYVEHVATPHAADFAGAATLFGLRHMRPSTLDEFRGALDAAVGSSETTLIEVRTDRAENRALHARIAEAVNRVSRQAPVRGRT